MEPDRELRVPVTGTVIRAGTYTLYCDNVDQYAVIEPDARPGWEVKVLHIEGLALTKGQRVEAGVTRLAAHARVLPFASTVEDDTAVPAWPHVHIEVVDPTVQDRPPARAAPSRQRPDAASAVAGAQQAWVPLLMRSGSRTRAIGPGGDVGGIEDEALAAVAHHVGGERDEVAVVLGGGAERAARTASRCRTRRRRTRSAPRVPVCEVVLHEAVEQEPAGRAGDVVRVAVGLAAVRAVDHAELHDPVRQRLLAASRPSPG